MPLPAAQPAAPLATAEPGTTPESDGLVRGIDLWGALSANVLNMVGVGPFLTIPLALAAMGGPQAMLGWVLGALLALCDGMVWAELGSRMPATGGPYHYLLTAFGAGRPGLGRFSRVGRVLPFLFLWQCMLTGPITIASGAVGFAQYLAVFHALSPLALKSIAIALCLINLVLLYRPIRSIGLLSMMVTVAVLATCAWIILSGALHFHPALAFSFPAAAFHLDHAFWLGLGSATLIATYDYGGYNTACLVGGEVQNPRRNIPRAVILSILLVAAMYLTMNVAILGVIPWQQGQSSRAIVADFMQAIYGAWATRLVSLLILVAAWGSAFANLLGYSRVPFTAAQDGAFPAVFARKNHRGHFPTVALVYMGLGSAVMCLFSLGELIAALIVVQTVAQFMAQCIAVIVLRRRDSARPGLDKPDFFHMPWYPLPALVALLGWAYIVVTSGWKYIVIAALLCGIGVMFYRMRSRRPQTAWPTP